MHPLYINMDIDTRINLKELSEKICGVPYQILILFFGTKSGINLLCEILESWQLESVNKTRTGK